MRFFIHDSDTGHEMEVTDNHMSLELGQTLFRRLFESGSLSSGTRVYEVRRGDANNPRKVMTSDGYVFREQHDGSWTDGDMSWEGYEEMYEAPEGDLAFIHEHRYNAGDRVRVELQSSEYYRRSATVKAVHYIHDGDVGIARIKLDADGVETGMFSHFLVPLS